MISGVVASDDPLAHQAYLGENQLQILRKYGTEQAVGDGDVADKLPGSSQEFVLNWTDLSDHSGYPALLAAREMVLGATEDYCEEHGKQFLERLDFSQLAQVTASKEGQKGAQSNHLHRARSAKAKRRRGRRRR